MRNYLAWSTLTIVVMLLALSVVPTQAAITYGRWRDINPTQYTADATVAGTLRGLAMRVGGTGAIGAGDGWAVGGDTCGLGTCPLPIISHYDGFSWQLLGSPVTSAEWNSVNFCAAPGAPGLGLCSPNGDGSDGWIVGNDGTGGHMRALYWNGFSLTEQSIGLGVGNLTSVFVACHQQLPTDGGGGCSGISGNALVVAVGSAAGAGVIYQFSGAGSSVLSGGWTPQTVTGVATTSYNSVYLFTGSCPSGPCLEGYAVGNGGVIAANMGSGWVATAQPGCTTNDLLGVFVYAVSGTAGSAVAVGRGGVVCSGVGSTWSAVSPGVTTNDLVGIFMDSSTEAWIVGQDSTILHTTSFPSGLAPMPVPLDTGTGTGITLTSVSFTGGGNGWAAGYNGVILQTSNGGCGSLPAPGSPLACWGGSTSVTQSPTLNAVFENSPTDAWAGGNFTALDGSISAVLIHWDGTRWHRATVTPLVANPDIQGLYFTGGGDGWAVGAAGCPSSGPCVSGIPAAFHWGGGGSTSSNEWAGIPITSCSCAAKSVFMTSGGYPGGNGWAVGTKGTIWLFSAGSFGTFSSPTTQNLNSVFVESPGSSSVAGYAVGDGGTILTLSYPSSSPVWTAVGPLNGVTAPLYSVYFKDSTHGWIVGGSTSQPAVVLTTTDGGITWSGGPNQVTGAPASGLVLYSVFVDTFGTGAGNGDGWAVGQDGSGNFVMVHYDGASWTVVPTSPALVAGSSSPGLALRSVSLTNPQDGWAVGAGVAGATNPLAGIFHLDPLNPPVVGQGTTSTSTATPATSTITVVSSSSSTSTASTPVTATTSSTSSPIILSTTSSLTTTEVSTSISTMTVVSTPTTTSTSVTSSVSTPMVLPAIPGFPWEAIIAGIILGMTALAIVRRRK